MPSKIGFRVIHASGQDENCKAVDLNQHHPTAKGWQASRYIITTINKQDVMLVQMLTRHH